MEMLDSKQLRDINTGTADDHTKLILLDSNNNPITITISQLASLLGITGVGGNLKFTGNSIDVTALSTDTLNDKAIGRPDAGGKAYIPFVQSDGVMEIESCIDYHHVGSTTDFDSRLGLNESGVLYCSGELTATKVWGLLQIELFFYSFARNHN